MTEATPTPAPLPVRTRAPWSTKKRDATPRGVFRHPSSTTRTNVWAIQFVCSLGHRHVEKVGPAKTEAVRAHHARTARVHAEPDWCPRQQRQQGRARQAEREAARRETEARQITVAAYADPWLRERAALRLRERTAERYQGDFRVHIIPALGHLTLGELTRTHVRDFLSGKAHAGLARGTVANLLVPLRAMLNTAVEDGVIPGNPAARLGRALPKRPARIVRALAAEELAGALAVARRLYPEHADLLHVLAWSGMRLGEAVGLQWGDVDVAGGFLEVNRSVQYRAHRLYIGSPKSGQERRVDIPRQLMERLRERRSLREAEAALAGRALSPWVFSAPSDDAKPMNPAFLRYKVWYRVLLEAGLRSVRLHDLRHTYAVLLLQAGEPVPYVSQQLGHSSIQVTVDIYGRFIPGANRQAVERLAAATAESPATPRATAPEVRLGAPALRDNYELAGGSGFGEVRDSATD